MDGKKFLSVSEKVNLEELYAGLASACTLRRSIVLRRIVAAPRSLVDEDKGKIWLNSICSCHRLQKCVPKKL